MTLGICSGTPLGDIKHSNSITDLSLNWLSAYRFPMRSQLLPRQAPGCWRV